MDDLISRQAVLDKAYEIDLSDTGNDIRVWVVDVAEVKKLPTAVIRCKDCEWFRKEYGWNSIEYTVCGISPTHHPIRGEEDFCSYAERRSDE